jgi:GxxExxY protein
MAENSEVKRPIEHADLTYRIIGAAMKVHNELGPGLNEVIYQRALSVAMRDDNLSFEEEKPIELTFDGEWIGTLYLDHLVEDRVVVEEKSFPHLLTDEEVAQAITYLAATGAAVGLLLNFGRGRLQYKRILPPAKLEEWQNRARRHAWKPKDARPAHPFIRSSAVDRRPAPAPLIRSSSAGVRPESSADPQIRSTSAEKLAHSPHERPA